MAEPAKTAGGYLWHPTYGKSAFMYEVDISNPLHGALVRFPGEWKREPWTDEEIKAYKARNAVKTLEDEDFHSVEPALAPAPAPAPKKPRGRPFTKKQPKAEKVDA